MPKRIRQNVPKSKVTFRVPADKQAPQTDRSKYYADCIMSMKKFISERVVHTGGIPTEPSFAGVEASQLPDTTGYVPRISGWE